jgi:hypothetical protein
LGEKEGKVLRWRSGRQICETDGLCKAFLGKRKKWEMPNHATGLTLLYNKKGMFFGRFFKTSEKTLPLD